MQLTTNTEIINGKYLHDEKPTVSVIECNRNGLLHACLLVEAGFKVICVDSDRAVVERLSKGRIQFLKQEIEPIIRKNLENGRLQASCNIEDAVSQSSVVLVTTPAITSERGAVTVDYSSIEKTLKKLGSYLQKNTLTIITSMVGIGVTENLLKEVLESSSGFRVGVDCFLAYSPVPFSEKQTMNSLAKCRRVVAAYDKTSLEKALKIIGAVTKGETIATLNLKAAEAAVLFEAVYRSVGFAFANELALLCERTGVDYLTVKSISPLTEAFYQPALDNFGEKALLMLLDEAENHNIKLKIPQAAVRSSREIIKHGVSLVQEALKNCGKTLRRAKIAILGVSQTQNMTDNPKALLKTFAKILERRGAKLSLHDPYMHRKTMDIEAQPLEESLIKTVEGADCIVIFTGHDQFKRLDLEKIKFLAKMPAAIVDFEGILDPFKVESEGFIYRGLGRGVWRK